MLSTIFLAFSLIAPAFADHLHLSNRHHAIAKRAETNLAKRNRFTFYDVGLGACGHVNYPNQFIVALNSPQYGGGYPGPHCHQTITIQYGGKTARATVMDECPGCPYGGLDMSRGLFSFFASQSEGVIEGSWYFDGGYDAKGDGPDQNGGSGSGSGGDGGDDDHTSTKKQTSTRTTYSFTATHSSTHSSTKQSTTSTSVERTTSSSTKTTSTSTQKPSTTSTSSSSSSAAPTPSVPAATNNDGETIQGINEAFVDMNAMIAYVATAK